MLPAVGAVGGAGHGAGAIGPRQRPLPARPPGAFPYTFHTFRLNSFNKFLGFYVRHVSPQAEFLISVFVNDKSSKKYNKWRVASGRAAISCGSALAFRLALLANPTFGFFVPIGGDNFWVGGAGKTDNC